MEKYLKNQNIYSCVSGDHMCVLECIYITIYKEEYEKWIIKKSKVPFKNLNFLMVVVWPYYTTDHFGPGKPCRSSDSPESVWFRKKRR
jgi:hypothetical protein